MAHWPDGHRDMCYMEVESEGDSTGAEDKGEDEEDSSVDGSKRFNVTEVLS